MPMVVVPAVGRLLPAQGRAGASDGCVHRHVKLGLHKLHLARACVAPAKELRPLRGLVPTRRAVAQQPRQPVHDVVAREPRRAVKDEGRDRDGHAERRAVPRVELRERGEHARHAHRVALGASEPVAVAAVERALQHRLLPGLDAVREAERGHAAL
eukprot:CAMPEP_0179950722 /NCGR_PEP_ID=MMETSP0983-20121128/23109_1 /TAXON_ID=483367 /ORGANISM="non described non described, Strain CCMP 2436" /LENGTH=155 /DNA_ID=CAMNT_0021860725 /DNA_START=59 /DNA_END=526 /DNA_ORIENTATION=-